MTESVQDLNLCGDQYFSSLLDRDELVFVSLQGGLLILQETLQTETADWTKASSGGRGFGRIEGLGSNPGHDQSLRSFPEDVLLPRLLHLTYCL